MEDFLNKLRESAVFFKLTSTTNGGAVNVEEIIKVLTSLSESYNSFVDIEYNRIATLSDRKRLNKIKRGLLDENCLMVVDLKFESCGMAISPNTVTANVDIPNIKKQIDWKQKTFDSYKNIVLNSDYNDTEYLKELAQHYSPLDRTRIFKPLIDGIINNKNATTKFGFGSETPTKYLKKPLDRNREILIPTNTDKIIIGAEEETKTSIALVEIKGGTTKPKIVELFEEIKNPVFSFNKLKHGDKEYILLYPIYCELFREMDSYSLENKQLGIYAFGKSVDEAQLNFAEEFDYIFTRYNSLEDKLLSDDVVIIKHFLNLIVS